MNVTFDQDDRLVVTTEDVDGKQKAFFYDVKTKEKKKEAANQSASELGEPLSPKFLENAYMGEFAIANVGDICVSYNRVMNSNTDDYARIYRDKKIVYRGNLMEGSNGLTTAISKDGKYVALIFEKLGDRMDLQFYLVDMSQLNKSLKPTKDLSNPGQLIREMKEKYHIEVSMPTDKELKDKQISAKAYKKSMPKSSVAKVYTMLSYFPETFFEQLEKVREQNAYGQLHIYLTDQIQTGRSESSTVGLACREYMLLDVSGDDTDLVKCAAHEFMHVLDDYIVSETKNLSKWNEYLPKGMDYHYGYENSQGKEYDDVAYTT